MDNKQPTLIERLHNEADQCRNDGADDIANLLGDCICEIRRLRAEVASEQKWGELWYFVSDDAPGEFERIVSEWTPSRWIGEAQKLMAEKR